jgi:hypothetical protein
MVGTAHHFVHVKNWTLKGFVNTVHVSKPSMYQYDGMHHYLQDIISKKTWTLLADNRLVNPFLVTFLKMTNLHPQN